MLKTQLACALFAAAATAFAQPGMMRRPDPMVQAIDTDGDGSISATELSRAASALATLDKNKDGQLSGDEVRPQFGGRPGPGRDGRDGQRGSQPGANSDDRLKTLMAFDANSDGQLSKTEVPERMQGLFTRGDKNNDGVLSGEELKAMVASQPGRPGNEGTPPAMMDPVRAALDTDRDGTISTAEMSAAPGALAKLDRNGDGMLDQTELRPRGGMRGPRGNPEEMYKHLLEENDKNGDGKLAVSELPERMREFLGIADANKDGFISQEEMMSMRPRERREDR